MINNIKKLYIEPSTLCNLNCTMCMRSTWKSEQMGHMDFSVYQKLIEEAADIKSIDTIFFGGIGEPMYHPQFLDMVRLASEAGKRVECVTNATMLDFETADKLREYGMRMVWTSIDALDKENYDKIRLGSDYDVVVNNILALREYREQAPGSNLGIGLTFVAMRDNIDQIPQLMQFAHRAQVNAVRITNVLPYTKDMVEQALYLDMLKKNTFARREENQSMDGVPYKINIDFPAMALTEEVLPNMAYMLSQPATFSMMNEPIGRKTNYCKFVQEGNVFVRWDGKVSPCMALIHESETYLHGHHRHIKSKCFGDLHNQSLLEVWNDEEFASFRQSVLDFDFSFCTYCGGCDRIDSNEIDCFGNEHPTCGGCLWAQGLIQCP